MREPVTLSMRVRRVAENLIFPNSRKVSRSMSPTFKP